MNKLRRALRPIAPYVVGGAIVLSSIVGGEWTAYEVGSRIHPVDGPARRSGVVFEDGNDAYMWDGAIAGFLLGSALVAYKYRRDIAKFFRN